MSAATRRLALLGLLGLLGCAAARSQQDLSRFTAAEVRSIVVLPVVNRSAEEEAADFLLATLPVPLAERGYYVFPTALVRRLLAADGLGDAARAQGADPVELCRRFGADAALYAAVERWDASYAISLTSVAVEVTWTLKSGRTGETLWTATRKLLHEPDPRNGGLLMALLGASGASPAAHYLPLARQLNQQVLAWPGPGFPAGPYHRLHGKDLPAPQRP